MRLNFSFDYTVTVDDNIDISSFAVPPLLIQPFIENAIWHGLKNRLEGGHLIIYIKKDVNCITYVVEDNGCIVKETATSILAGNIKKTSMGQGIVQGRLDVLNKINRTNVAGYKMEPQFDSAGCYVGSRTTVTIPLLEI
jgi:sensor histidine kinase YesM